MRLIIGEGIILICFTLSNHKQVAVFSRFQSTWKLRQQLLKCVHLLLVIILLQTDSQHVTAAVSVSFTLPDKLCQTRLHLHSAKTDNQIQRLFFFFVSHIRLEENIEPAGCGGRLRFHGFISLGIIHCKGNAPSVQLVEHDKIQQHHKLQPPK